MSQVSPLTIERSVIELCRYLPAFHYSKRSRNIHDERDLWEKAVRAILSSQVEFETAVAFSTALVGRGLLPLSCSRIATAEHEEQLFEVLQGSLLIKQKKRRYRFPKIKAKQLAATSQRFFETGRTLSGMLQSSRCPKELRGQLIEWVDGMGAKQASMFVRDTGFSDEIAIIDTHILDYMKILGIGNVPNSKQISPHKYYSLEDELIRYARFLDLPLGQLDWSIWMMMRVIKKEAVH